MKTVELKTAYHWNCDECGEDNFALPRKVELTEEDREQAFRDIHGLQEWDELPDNWQNFELVCIPEVVKCVRCGEEFGTLDERCAPEEDEEP